MVGYLGSSVGWMTVVLGVVGALGSIFSLIVFETIGVMFLSELVFLLDVGQRVYVKSRNWYPT